MREDASTIVDLDALALRGGEAARLDLRIVLEAPMIAGELLSVESDRVDARVDISRTSSGFALRLRLDTTLAGTCARCLGPAEREVRVDVREIDQASADDEELRSPYVADGLLDVGAWVRDALTLNLPERLLCRPDCAGLCAVCGVSLNEVDPDEHIHERPPDPRFAKLRELTDG